jgi:outer membrane protein OmpA-like peptidoglycan-associated protein
MSWVRGALASVAVVVLLAAPSAAQIGGHPIELSGGAGVFSPDARARVKLGPAYDAAIGWRLLPGIALEGQATWGPSKADSLPRQPDNFTMYGLDLRWSLRPADARAVPFLLFGAGYGKSHTSGHRPDVLERGAATVGVGLLQNVLNERAYLRFEARDIMFRDRDQQGFSNHVAVTAGLQWSFLGKEKDQDLDHVRDWLDQCPNTPIGAKVDAKGCPIDTDGDGVFDGIDQCVSTPRGCKVDAKGCPIDTDGDGVCDGLDRCPGTPKGAIVDAEGCALDSDGDGVYDGLDSCAATPKGCTVDPKGCPVDADGDGVCDGLDKCPNTPAGLRVDDAGCPIEVNEKETQLLDTGSIRLSNIQFEVRKANLKPESFALIDTVGMILVQYPTLKIEIGGHTDNRGSAALNDTLSQSRAGSVLRYLESKFPQLPADQFTAKGYGFSKPIAPNTTDLGRSKNRRVEFKVLNTEALKIERERRYYLRKDSTAPPMTPSAPSDSTKSAAPGTMQVAPPDTTKH